MALHKAFCGACRDGSVYKGSRFNILTVIALVSILTPLAGLAFAWWSYGVLWG